MKTEEAWSGDFGNAYLARNRVQWRRRIPFWQYIIETTGARSVFEFGANAAWNLSAIQRADPSTQLTGCDINWRARCQAKSAGIKVYGNLDNVMREGYELAFTSGVLIHIPPDDLESVMQSIINASCDYVLAIEYDSEKEEEVNYRGNDGMLWKRPYGQLYQDLGLTLVESKWSIDGWDNCTYWLLRR